MFNSSLLLLIYVNKTINRHRCVWTYRAWNYCKFASVWSKKKYCNDYTIHQPPRAIHYGDLRAPSSFFPPGDMSPQRDGSFLVEKLILSFGFENTIYMPIFSEKSKLLNTCEGKKQYARLVMRWLAQLKHLVENKRDYMNGWLGSLEYLSLCACETIGYTEINVRSMSKNSR